MNQFSQETVRNENLRLGSLEMLKKLRPRTAERTFNVHHRNEYATGNKSIVGI